MTTNNYFKSDLYNLYNIIQGSMIVYPKEMIISVLRKYFSNDSYYHYVKDEWGFSKTVDHTNLPLGQGLKDNTATRLYIGENYRYDAIYYPAILIKSGSMRYVPISINREKGSIKYDKILYQDTYGNSTVVNRPKYFITAGAFEGSLQIDVLTRSLRSRDDLVENIAIALTEIFFEDLCKSGIVIKPISIGSPTETDDRVDKLFRQSITVDIRCEWRREIPIGNLIDTIALVTEFVDLRNPDAPVAQNLTIKTYESIYDLY